GEWLRNERASAQPGRGQVANGCEGLLPRSQAVHQGVRRRWDIRRVRQRCAGCPDPVLCLSEFAGRRMVTADTGHKLRVKLSSESKRQRYRREGLAPVLEGDRVLRHFAEIRRAPFYCCTPLRSEQLSEGRLGAF